MRTAERDQVVSVRLSIDEKRRLEVFAHERDLRLGQACRQFINKSLAAGSAQDEPHDDRAA